MKLGKMIRHNFDAKRKQRTYWSKFKINILANDFFSFSLEFVSSKATPVLTGKYDTVFGSVKEFHTQYWIMITGHNPIEGSIEFVLYMDKPMINKFIYTQVCEAAVRLYKDSKLYRDYMENEAVDDWILNNMPEDGNPREEYTLKHDIPEDDNHNQ